MGRCSFIAPLSRPLGGLRTRYWLEAASYILGIAYRMDYRIVLWSVDFPCPPEQPADNLAEFVHRVLQLSQNLQGLVLSMTISHAHMPPDDAPEAQG